MAAGDDGAIKYSSHTGTGTRKPQARPQGSKRVAWYCRYRGYERKKQENSGERQRTEKEKEREKKHGRTEWIKFESREKSPSWTDLHV